MTASYDGDGLKVKEIATGNQNTTTYYLRSSVLNGQVLEEINSHGVYTTNGGQTWGPAGSSGNSYVPVDFQYTVSTAANINWLVTDQLGTPRMVFDRSYPSASS